MDKSKNKTLTSNLKFYLVTEDDTGENISEEMQTAFETGREYMPFANGVQWITARGCMKLNSENIAETDVFIFPKFEGEAFDYLQKSSALILGPRCFMSCLLDNTPVPLGSTPVYTAAMNGLVISASGLSVIQKTEIGKLIKLMGGHYMGTINMAITHLVSNTVKSNKYEKAGETQKIKIMHPDWVDDVWRISQTRNILATDKAFDKHTLPVFYNLKITTTELSMIAKNEIRKLIDSNGGTFIGAFHSDTTDILVLEPKSISSSKYTAAIRYKKDCVTPKWIYDSVANGYAIEMTEYRVVSKTPKISTPTKLGFNATLDCSQLSIISHKNDVQQPLQINETITSRTSVSSNSPPMNTRTTRNSKSQYAPVPRYKDVFAKLNIQAAKKAGPLLEECCIYLSGFTTSEKEKLHKLLNITSATRYDEPVDKVTHVIIGEENLHELKLIKKKLNCHFVKVDWLVECIKQKHIIDEVDYLFDLQTIVPEKGSLETPSPSSKKSIQSMSNSFKRPKIPKFDLNVDERTASKPGSSASFQDERENEIINKYLQESQNAIERAEDLPGFNSNTQPKSNSDAALSLVAADEEKSAMMPSQIPVNEATFLKNIKICLFGFEEDVEAQLIEDCTAWGADIVDDNFTDAVDFMIVPVIIKNELSTDIYKAKHIVNELWMEDVVQENRLLDVEYYHKPVVCNKDLELLKGLTLVFSTYNGIEKTFLSELGTGLGAKVEAKYNRISKPILICPKPEGQKYDGSVKWNLPAVTNHWLLDCVARQKRLELDPYFVGKEYNEEGSHIIPSTQKSIGSESDGHLNTKKRKSDELSDDAENCDITNNSRLINSKINKVIEADGHTLGLSSGSNDSLSPASYRVKDYATPVRAILYRGWKEKEAKDRIDKLLQTPGTNNRLQRDADTPKIPENMRTPEAYWGLTHDSTPDSRALHRNQMSVLQNYRRPQTEIKPTTPFSEIRKKFWGSIFGESTDDASSSQILTQKVDPPAATQSGATQHTGAEHVKELREFIKNRSIEQRSISYQNYEDVDSIPLRANSEMIGTENEVIGWRDPHEFNDLRRNNKEPMKYKGVPYFMISCAEPSTKEKLIGQIRQLKGQICDPNLKYDPKCTHVVCEQLNRGEKIFSSIASGKWILDINYIQDSLDAGFFLEEEQYEWGNPKATNLPELAQMEQNIANAAHRWRVRICTQAEKKSGIFTGFRVILHVVKKEQFACLIKAGGGVVIDVLPPYEDSDEALTATHCFVENKKLKLKRDDHKAFAESGVQVLNVMYLNAYLTSDNMTESSKYQISLN